MIHFRHVATEAGGANGTESLGNGDFELRARLMPEEWRDLP